MKRTLLLVLAVLAALATRCRILEHRQRRYIEEAKASGELQMGADAKIRAEMYAWFAKKLERICHEFCDRET